MSVRKVLAPLVGGPNDGATLAAAIAVSQGLGAHLEVCFVRPDPEEAVPYMGMGGAHLEEIREEYRRHAEATGKKAAIRARRRSVRSLGAQRVRCPKLQSFATSRFLPGR